MALSFIVPHDLPQKENNENASSNTNSDPDEHLRNLHFPVEKSPALSLDDIAQKTGSKNVYLTHHKLHRNRKQNQKSTHLHVVVQCKKNKNNCLQSKKMSTERSKAIQEV